MAAPTARIVSFNSGDDFVGLERVVGGADLDVWLFGGNTVLTKGICIAEDSV